LQTYYDRTNRDTAILGEKRNTFDVDFQHRFAWGDRQTIVWGGGYRLTSDEIRNTFDASLDPGRRSSNLFSAFVQDEIVLVEKRLVLTLGSKFEHNDFTGFELQPSARLLWTPNPKQSFWGSISRAVRTPSRAEDDIHLRGEPVIPQGAIFAGLPALGIPPSPTIVTSIAGRRGFDSEKLIAYELGYRVQVAPRVSLDAAVFYNDYDELRSLELASATPDFTTSPAQFSVFARNKLKGETYGGELSLTYQPTDWWRFRADYAHLQTALHLDGGTDVGTERGIEGSSPQNQFALRSSIDLPHGFEFDVALRYVDSLPALHVPSYLELDLRLAWRLSENVEFSIVGHNLLDNSHPEFKPTIIATQPAEIERSIYGKITVRF
jgi:iron complex outermembrane receptor protein